MIHNTKIWVVDDERIVRLTLADDLRDAGFIVREFGNANSTLIALKTEKPDIIFSDIMMPEMDGIELLGKTKKLSNDISVVMMTAHGSVENAVEAMKLGAYDFITKPFSTEEMLIVIDRILEFKSVVNENTYLKKQITTKYDFNTYIGNPEYNNQLFDQIKLIANKDTTVLVTGETGTGKELVTNLIHYNSDRNSKPLIKVSCAILAREIFESELFGHVKGAFTGADNDKTGRFELANNGTLYLDDIDDIPLDLQVNLLRAIEQREIEKVGSTKSIPINVRIIASTKVDLFKLVQQGKFREDLFYRLNVFPIHLLPLRERETDIKTIFNYFYLKYSDEIIGKITKDVYKKLAEYSWPGNVRELKNIAERIAILAQGKDVEIKHIPVELLNKQNIDVCSLVGSKPLEQILMEIEKNSIICAMNQSNNNKSKAANVLGIPLSTLRSKMLKLNL